MRTGGKRRSTKGEYRTKPWGKGEKARNSATEWLTVGRNLETRRLIVVITLRGALHGGRGVTVLSLLRGGSTRLEHYQKTCGGGADVEDHTRVWLEYTKVEQESDSSKKRRKSRSLYGPNDGLPGKGCGLRRGRFISPKTN